MHYVDPSLRDPHNHHDQHLAATRPDHRPPRPWWREAGSTLGALALALVLAFALVSFVFRSYEVNGVSMANTLQNGNRLLIWKVPRSWADLTGHPYIPKRGDIIVFNEPDLLACNQTGSKQLVKRVIGLPGDRVTIKNNAYVIYNKQHPDGFDPDTSLGYFKGVTVPPTTGDTDITLAANQLFVSGDNRPQSCDSRAFGPIHTNQVIGQLALRLLPLHERHIF